MACPILCFECGELIGPIFEFINFAKQGFFKEDIKNTNVNIDNVGLNPYVIKPIGFILDAVNLNNICCRKTILGYIDYNQFFK